MNTPERMQMNSADLTALDVEKLMDLFPVCVTETRDAEGNLTRAVDFEKLRVLLGDKAVTPRDEAYDFTWVGKRDALAEARRPITKTLRPCKEESEAWDTTKNLYIEGDNLEVLKLLQKSYLGKVKLIYIDPPYNTGKDFVYPDSFMMTNDEYNDGTGYFDEDGNINYSRENDPAKGKYHSDWCSMIYSRLMLARNLLSDDGTIFISIDDNEFHTLRSICNEVFGERNFIATFIWTKTSTPPSLSKKCRKTVEYVLAYEKSSNNRKYFGEFLENGDAPLLNTGNQNKKLVFPPKSVKFNFITHGTIQSGIKEKVILHDDILVEENYNLNPFSLTGPFKWGQENLFKEITNGSFFIVKTSGFSIRYQRVANEETYKTPTNFINLELNKSQNVGTNEGAQKELLDLGLPKSFDYAKPTSLLKKLIQSICFQEKEALVLDFFSGSSTTAHAILQQNSERLMGFKKDSDLVSQIKFIMVQLPEPTNEITEAHKQGFSTISDLGKERIRRAGAKIKSENPLVADKLDVGFRVLKVDSSNMEDVFYGVDDLEPSLLASENIKPDRSDVDLLFGCLVDWGLELSDEYHEETIEGVKVLNYADGALLACFEKNVPESAIRAIAQRQPDRAVFRDSCFKDSAAKINVYEIFRRFAPDATVKTL